MREQGDRGAHAASVRWFAMPVSDDDLLRPFGWDADWARAAATAGTDPAGRVARVDFGRVSLLTADGPAFATPGADPVATGDWVLFDGEEVTAVLPRRSAFVRGDPMEGEALDAQVLAANIDVVLIVQSLTNGPNVRRLERELVLTYESGATPIVVLTKADLVDAAEVGDATALASDAAPGVEVLIDERAERAWHRPPA